MTFVEETSSRFGEVNIQICLKSNGKEMAQKRMACSNWERTSYMKGQEVFQTVCVAISLNFTWIIC